MISSQNDSSSGKRENNEPTQGTEGQRGLCTADWHERFAWLPFPAFANWQ